MWYLGLGYFCTYGSCYLFHAMHLPKHCTKTWTDVKYQGEERLKTEKLTQWYHMTAL